MIPSELLEEYIDLNIKETENEIEKLKGKLDGLYSAKDNLNAAIYTTDQNNLLKIKKEL
jgi:hypothetical protein